MAKKSKKPPPTPAEVEQEIADLLASWGDAFEIIHEGHKKYHAIMAKKTKGRSPLTIEDHFILGDKSLKAKYSQYGKYNTLKAKLKKAQKNSA